ncbi:hypothetical protein [Streptomyces sp. NPDC018031]
MREHPHAARDHARAAELHNLRGKGSTAFSAEKQVKISLREALEHA